MQSAMTLAGMVVLFIIANLDYRFFVDRLWLVMLGASVFLLVITLILGNSGQNIETANKSWLRIPVIGISIQPSEFVKITFLCTFSKHIDMVRDRINRPLIALGLLVHAGLIVGLILLSGDLGVALVCMGIVAVMLFCSGLSLWYFLGVAVILVISFPILWELLQPYQRERILYGFTPESDPLGVGQQPLESRDAIIRGGLWGEGMQGGNVYKQLYAADTDFIFSTYCEKFGFIGAILLLIVMLIFVWRLIRLARLSRHDYGAYICIGIAAMIVVQTVENIGMCLCMLPVVGITLPFMSCGGSSTLAIYITLGMVHSIYNHRVRFYYERDRR